VVLPEEMLGMWFWWGRPMSDAMPPLLPPSLSLLSSWAGRLRKRSWLVLPGSEGSREWNEGTGERSRESKDTARAN